MGQVDDIPEKLIYNALIDGYKRKKISKYELAVITKKYMDAQFKKGKKLEDIEKELGVGKKELYRCTSLLKLDKKTINQLSEFVTLDKLSRILYSLKDKEKIEEVVKEVHTKKLNTTQTEYYVAEVNDPYKVGSHFLTIMSRFMLEIEKFKKKTKGASAEQQAKIKNMAGNISNSLDDLKKAL